MLAAREARRAQPERDRAALGRAAAARAADARVHARPPGRRQGRPGHAPGVPRPQPRPALPGAGDAPRRVRRRGRSAERGTPAPRVRASRHARRSTPGPRRSHRSVRSSSERDAGRRSPRSPRRIAALAGSPRPAVGHGRRTRASRRPSPSSRHASSGISSAASRGRVRTSTTSACARRDATSAASARRASSGSRFSRSSSPRPRRCRSARTPTRSCFSTTSSRSSTRTGGGRLARSSREAARRS